MAKKKHSRSPKRSPRRGGKPRLSANDVPAEQRPDLPVPTIKTYRDAALLVDALRAEGSTLVPPAPAPTALTFGLSDLHALIGDAHVPIGEPATPLDFACEALISTVRSLALIGEAFHDDNLLSDAVFSVRQRAEGALGVLSRVGRAERLSKRVASTDKVEVTP